MRYSALFAALVAGTHAQTTSTSAAAAASSAVASLSSLVSSVGGATNTQTSLLPVPTYAFANSTQSTNATLAKSLPAFTYNLTSESATLRAAICTQMMNVCSVSGCINSNATVSTNFCNNVTMGYDCECTSSSESREFMQEYLLPINLVDCQFRSRACLDACLKPGMTSSTNDCQTACNSIYADTCGTSSQQIPEYRVSNPSATPSYYPDTSKGGVLPTTSSDNTSSASKIAVSVTLSLGFLAGLCIVL
ncbi:uncharacterized protein L969DRAFT_87326 [Mixia osmundae IAM 14324]|uniref:DUF7707 domain-containing protein n=1 Tax=Mixia osmundae (strain CBS 9802 / IAM 14324 / JCM 22182 / KY 12970) TaxID=764103 RepID=G7E3G9_MIXOS|nr:uncharacterized protein L969DRAFT_87326 [Mixia osmundae IAM 14324]KEI39366.1 hypothetical protein L969DRAFT_87326 [Mixia osmundae IAM 14324]GAA97379.1 hypothetical protein E5Q_04057 [Mixia osmundae IAM 14324]